jgi:hypothetical protein
VAQTSRCLDDLSPAQRRVLTLRAGVGAGPPRSRGGVARRLNITVRRVVRLERTGLRRLRTLAGSGGCAAPDQPQPRPQTSTAGVVAPVAAAALGTRSSNGNDGGASGGGSGGESGNGGGSESDGNRGGTGAPGESPRNGGVAGVSQTNPSRSADLTIPLLLLLLALAAAATTQLLRRGAGRVPLPVAGAADEPAEAPRPAWVPWRRSTMDGPGWTSTPPPSREGAGEWAAAPGTAPEPEHHDGWTPPSSRRRVH